MVEGGWEGGGVSRVVVVGRLWGYVPATMVLPLLRPMEASMPSQRVGPSAGAGVLVLVPYAGTGRSHEVASASFTNVDNNFLKHILTHPGNISD